MASRLILLMTALIWGSTFIAQRLAAGIIEPITFNGIRFVLGALTISPLLFLLKKTEPTKQPQFHICIAAAIIGFFLFTGNALQQYAIAYTTASKAAFITALYIVLIPIVSYFLGHTLGLYSILGVIIAIVGAAMLTLQGDLTLQWGDTIMLVSTLFWVGHILCMGNFAKRYDPIRLSMAQFLACAFYSLIFGSLFESPTLAQIEATWIPIVWGGVLSAGLGYTGQLIGQRNVPPTEASLIMSLEMVFAALIAYWFLGERLSTMELMGTIAMTIGVVLAQLPSPPQLTLRQFKSTNND